MQKSSDNSGLFYARTILALILSIIALLFVVVSFSSEALAGKISTKKAERKAAQSSLAQTASGTGNTGPGWAIVSSPNTTEQRLLSATCVSTTDCWAVGYYVNNAGGHRPLVEHWDGYSWKLVTAPNGIGPFGFEGATQLESIACTVSSDCWAVGTASGANTVTEHWNGTAWSVVSSPNPSAVSNQLHAVACSSSIDCWAVGTYKTGTQNRFTQTLIEHWNGSSWSVTPSPNTGPTLQNKLNGVTCTSSSNCWAVGYARTNTSNQAAQTLIQHWDGTNWSILLSTNLSTSGDNVLTSVDCIGANDCWTVGYYDSGVIGANGTIYQTLSQHWTGVAWLTVTSGNTSLLDSNFLLGITCVSSSQCWTVGYAYGSTSEQAVIEQWNGSTWSIVSSPSSPNTQFNYLYAVTCASASQCWATGNSGFEHTLTERWDGTTWAIAPSADAAGGGSDDRLKGVSCASSTDCWTVGQNSQGESFVQHWNGQTWSVVFVPSSLPAHFNTLTSVRCSAMNDCLSVGYYDNNAGFEQTLAEHWDGTSWAEVDPLSSSPAADNSLFGLTCVASGDCWAVGRFNDVSGNSNSLADHWNGTAWVTIPSPNVGAAVNVLSGVSCASSSDCWAVGWSADVQSIPRAQPTLIEHWNGTAWAVVNSPSPGMENYLFGVSCVSSSDCSAVGTYQTAQGSEQMLLERWDGTSWTVASASGVLVSTSSLQDVTCASSLSCWAVGTGDGKTLALHWDGSTWTPASTPNNNLGQSNTLHAITCNSDVQCWAVGEYDLSFGGPNIGQTLIEEYSITVPPLFGATSRMTHGSAGAFDVDLPLTGKRGVECRNGNGNYSVVFTFVNDVTNCGSAPTADGTVVAGPNSNQCTENLTGVANAQYINVELDSVVDVQSNTGNVAVQMGVLIGDTTANGTVNSSDIAQVQSQSGQSIGLGNFRADVTLNGTINSSDIALVQSTSGTGLPTSP